jgi:hypothetical protein
MSFDDIIFHEEGHICNTIGGDKATYLLFGVVTISNKIEKFGFFYDWVNLYFLVQIIV